MATRPVLELGPVNGWMRQFGDALSLAGTACQDFAPLWLAVDATRPSQHADSQHFIMAKQLPAHLSHKSALALLPTLRITAPIEAVRRVHDRHFARWPPHINLLYPFLSSPSDVVQGEDRQLNQEIRSRVQEAVRNIKPFRVHLDASRPGVFSHGRKSKTVWLGPSTQSIQQLQEALRSEFSECNSDQRPFVPHLSVGQASSKEDAELLGETIKESVADYLTETGEAMPLSLEWDIDTVFVIEREGYNDRFKVVGAIKLGDKTNASPPSVLSEEVPHPLV